MADTITTAPVITLPIGHAVANALLQAICRRRGHRWRDFGGPLPHGQRRYCVKCESQMVELADGGSIVCTKAELLAREPTFAEALYLARWGEPPRRRMRRGEWPAV